MRLQEIVASVGAEKFLGVPTENFECGGREQFAFLLKAGLNPDSRLVDLGCGVLRAGYWTVHFLDADCYCGIEPHRGRLEIGKRFILEPEILEIKRPRFDHNDTFDTSVFGEKFDFFVAYSIWTHASKRQIGMMLDSFLKDSKDTGVFLVTFLPSRWGRPDYRGEKWFGTSHESDVPGCIHHSYRWIKDACKRRGLGVCKLGRDDTHNQSWLKIARISAMEGQRGQTRLRRIVRQIRRRLWA